MEDTGRRNLTYPRAGRMIPPYIHDRPWLDMPTDRIACGYASDEDSLALSPASSTHTGDLKGLSPFHSVTVADFPTKSRWRYARGLGLGFKRIQEMFDLRHPVPRRVADSAITPPDTTHAATPPLTTVVSDASDLQTNDNCLMAARPQLADAIVKSNIEPGVTHGSTSRNHLTSATDACLASASRNLEAPP